MIDFSQLRGFNYQPSYGTSGLELWRQFDAGVVERELRRGKEVFPWMNAIRLWLSWDAYQRDARRFVADFETALQAADCLGLRVMPVLFNRWHTNSIDYGGIYIDHFLPGSRNCVPGLFEPFLEDVVGSHRSDPRIPIWDLCNEPLFYGGDEIPEPIVTAEIRWLEGIYSCCKRLGATAPLTVCPMCRFEELTSIRDVISIHPYYMGGSREGFERMLDQFVALAARERKPLIATETCWGSYDDAIRAELVEYTLEELNRRRIGWLAYLLYHSGVADAHDRDKGAFSKAGNLAFLTADGQLRPGHEVVQRLGATAPV